MYRKQGNHLLPYPKILWDLGNTYLTHARVCILCAVAATPFTAPAHERAGWYCCSPIPSPTLSPNRTKCAQKQNPSSLLHETIRLLLR